jgi:hypothetical protein
MMSLKELEAKLKRARAAGLTDDTQMLVVVGDTSDAVVEVLGIVDVLASQTSDSLCLMAAA